MKPMNSLFLFACFLLLWTSRASAQEDTAYQTALQRIRDAQASGATVLDLSNLALGELPPEISNLANLRELYLHDNRLSSLPAEIGSFTLLIGGSIHVDPPKCVIAMVMDQRDRRASGND
jgi:hypothetical protein